MQKSAGRVLVIDDSAMIRQLLIEYFTTRGYEVTGAGTGGEGIAVLAANPDIEVVILDYKLPDTDGLKVLQRIKPGFPAEVILLTGMLTDELDRQAMHLGACASFEKPPNLSALAQTLDACASRVREKKDTDNRKTG